MTSAEIVRARVLLRLEADGTKRQKFAAIVHRSPSWVSMFLAGLRPFPFEHMDAVAAFFRCSPSDLVAPLTSEEVRRSGLGLDDIVEQLKIGRSTNFAKTIDALRTAAEAPDVQLGRKNRAG